MPRGGRSVAPVGDDHLLAVPHPVEVAAEVVLEVSDPDLDLRCSYRRRVIVLWAPSRPGLGASSARAPRPGRQLTGYRREAVELGSDDLGTVEVDVVAGAVDRHEAGPGGQGGPVLLAGLPDLVEVSREPVIGGGEHGERQVAQAVGAASSAKAAGPSSASGLFAGSATRAQLWTKLRASTVPSSTTAQLAAFPGRGAGVEEQEAGGVLGEPVGEQDRLVPAERVADGDGARLTGRLREGVQVLRLGGEGLRGRGSLAPIPKRS